MIFFLLNQNIIKQIIPNTDMKKIFASTTLFAVIGTIIYALLFYLIYPSYASVTNLIIFFVVVWIVYYFIAKAKHKY